MVCKLDLVFDIILLHYYSVNTLLKVFFIVDGGLLLVFGTAAIYNCSAATECSHRVCTIGKSAWLYSYLGNVTIKVAWRKPRYNIGMLGTALIGFSRI